jgi:hypothetical protein
MLCAMTGLPHRLFWMRVAEIAISPLRLWIDIREHLLEAFLDRRGRNFSRAVAVPPAGKILRRRRPTGLPRRTGRTMRPRRV